MVLPFELAIKAQLLYYIVVMVPKNTIASTPPTDKIMYACMYTQGHANEEKVRGSSTADF